MIRVDYTAESIVIICTSCDWRTMADTRMAGWRQGLAHQRAVHPGDANALHAAINGVDRHRAKETPPGLGPRRFRSG